MRVIPLIILLAAPSLSLYGLSNKIPDTIRMQVESLSIRFRDMLQDECPQGLCQSLGCQTIQYQTLDDTQKHALPGFQTRQLKDDVRKQAPAYQLSSVRCAFAHEPEIDNPQLKAIKERLRIKLSTPGVNISMTTRRLRKRIDGDANVATEKTWKDELWQTLLPFMPWTLVAMILGTLAILAALILIWAKRRLGKKMPLAETNNSIAPEILFEKAERLQRIMRDNRELALAVIQPILDRSDIDDLCLLLRFFGPSCFDGVRDQPRNFAILEKLSEAYVDFEHQFDPNKGLAFLENIEKRLAAVQVRLKTRPVSEAFRFLEDLTSNEFLMLIKNLNEEQLLATISYAPSHFIDAFVDMLGPDSSKVFLSKVIDRPSLDESLVRDTAQILRQRTDSAKGKYRQIMIDRVNVIEGVVNTLPGQERKKVISGLLASGDAAQRKITSAIFLDDSLPLFPGELLDELFITVPHEDLIPFLQALSPDIHNDVMEQLSTKISRALEHKLESADQQLDRSAVQRARTALASIVKRKHSNGEIDLIEINRRCIETR